MIHNGPVNAVYFLILLNDNIMTCLIFCSVFQCDFITSYIQCILIMQLVDIDVCQFPMTSVFTKF